MKEPSCKNSMDQKLEDRHLAQPKHPTPCILTYASTLLDRWYEQTIAIAPIFCECIDPCASCGQKSLIIPAYFSILFGSETVCFKRAPDSIQHIE